MMAELTRKKVIVKVAHPLTQSTARATKLRLLLHPLHSRPHDRRIACAVLSVPRLSGVDGAWERDI